MARFFLFVFVCADYVRHRFPSYRIGRYRYLRSRPHSRTIHTWPGMKYLIWQGGNSQNFFGKFVRFFVTLGLKILRLFRLKVVFEADIMKS